MRNNETLFSVDRWKRPKDQSTILLISYNGEKRIYMERLIIKICFVGLFKIEIYDDRRRLV